MTIDLTLENASYHMVAKNATGQTITLDNAPDAERKGMSPMEAVASGLAGCSSIDVLHILRKGRYEVDSFRVHVDAQRREEPIPRVFEAIHLHFVLEGDLPEDVVRRAIELSLDEYCSVSKMIEKTATITYDFTLNGKKYAGRSETTATG